jgi:membrane dipeptidase
MRLALALLLALTATAGADDLADRARKIQREAIIVDGHLDAPYALHAKYASIAVRGATDHFDLPRAKEGGLTAPFFSIYVSPMYAGNGAARNALELIDLTRRVVAEHANDTMLATTADDIRAAKKAGKLAILMGIEGGHAIEDSLGVLREMYRAGVRYMTLTHVNTNNWADSSGPYFLPDFDPKQSKVHGGLTDFGREVVKEMNRLGMIVDISHVSDDTVDDVLETTRAPVMASHSSCRALASNPRNLTDDQIKRIAAKGGLVMINFGSTFLDQSIWDDFVALRKKSLPQWRQLKKRHAKNPPAMYAGLFALYAAAGRKLATHTKVADHIEHVIKVAGPDAVGLGTDYDGVPDTPTGLEDYSKLTKLTEELLRRGHDAKTIKKVLGENFLAFMARVEAAKKMLAKEPPGTAVYKPKK